MNKNSESDGDKDSTEEKKNAYDRMAARREIALKGFLSFVAFQLILLDRISSMADKATCSISAKDLSFNSGARTLSVVAFVCLFGFICQIEYKNWEDRKIYKKKTPMWFLCHFVTSWNANWPLLFALALTGVVFYVTGSNQ